MYDRYKIIISNKNVYKEIEIAPEIEKVVVGTSLDRCKIKKRAFF